MDALANENTCRICLKSQVTVYSLFRKQKGIYPYEILKKVGVKADINDTGPTCICYDCLQELDITINFLKKCEKSNQFLAHLARRLDSEQNIIYNGDANTDHENNACNLENNSVEVNVDSVADKKSNGDISMHLEESKCAECGSKRRCRHWTPPKTHTCPYCQKVFSRKFNFKLHLGRHSGSHDWWCRSCGTRTLSRWLAAAHCAPRPQRTCPVPGCGKTYTTNTNLKTHMRLHTGERPFECSDCGKKFMSKNTLSDHVRIHTGALPYVCPVCGKRFRTNKLGAHLATHAPSAPPAPSRTRTARAPLAHACPACPARYRHRQSLNKHLRKHHQNFLPADKDRSAPAKETV